MKVTKQFLKEKEKRANDLLANCGSDVSFKVTERYDKTAIDLYRGNQLQDAFASGLTKKEANLALNGIITGASSVCKIKSSRSD